MKEGKERWKAPIRKKEPTFSWPANSVSWSAILYTKMLWVQFQLRFEPSWDSYRRQVLSMFLSHVMFLPSPPPFPPPYSFSSLSFSFPPSLPPLFLSKINKPYSQVRIKKKAPTLLWPTAGLSASVKCRPWGRPGSALLLLFAGIAKILYFRVIGYWLKASHHTQEAM